MFKIQMLNRPFISRFLPDLCPTYTVFPVRKIRERKTEHLFKQPGKPFAPNVSPSSTGGEQGVKMPAWLFLSRLFLSGFVFLSCGGKHPTAVDACVYMCGNIQETVTSFLKAAGWRGGWEIRNTSCQTAHKQDVKLLPAQNHIMWEDKQWWGKVKYM